MDPWTVADVEAVKVAAQTAASAAVSLREVLVSLFFLGTIFLGWSMGAVMLPSRDDWSG